MPLNDRYRFQAELSSESGAPVGVIPLQPDWGSVVEWCRFEGIREGRRVSPGHVTSAVIEPVWHARSGPPYVERISVGLTDVEGDTFLNEISTALFHSDIETASLSFVSSGELRPGEKFGFRLCAFTDPAIEHKISEHNDLEGEAVEIAMPTVPLPLDELISSSERRGIEHWNNNDLPVFFPQSLIDQLCRQASEDAELESGSILVGHLCQDIGDGNDADQNNQRLFLQLTAQLPAPHTIAEYASLTFTGETWAAIDAIVRLRAENEIITGWAHSHPFFCRKCPPADRLNCVLSRPMFSAADVNVHRTVFAHAYQVAMLLSFLGEEQPRSDLFAWREGRVVPRGFYVY